MAVSCHTCDFGGGAGFEGTLFCEDGSSFTFGTQSPPRGSCASCKAYGESVGCGGNVASVARRRGRRGRQGISSTLSGRDSMGFLR